MTCKPKHIEFSRLILEKPRNGLYKGKEYQGSGNRWIKMGDIYKDNFFYNQPTERIEVSASEIKRFSCLPGDLLFGRTSLTLEGVGDCMLIGSIKDQPIFESNLFRIRLNQEKASPLFYFYFFKSSIGKRIIQKIAKQTAATSITASDLIEQDVPYFERKYQDNIASFIHRFDKKIELNRQTNATLEAMAQALFKSWFVDFDPVIDNALAAGNPIPEALQARAQRRAHYHEQNRQQPNPQAPLPQHIATLFPNRFVESETLDWVPEGWEVKPISTIATINKEAWTKKNSPEFVEYVDLANTKDGSILETTHYSFTEAPSRARRVLRTDDTIFGTVRPGNRSFAFINQEGLTGSTGFAVLRAKKQNFRSFIYLATTRPESIELFAHLADGAAYPAIRPDLIGAQPVAVASNQVVDKFDQLAYGWLKKAGEARKESATLSQLRDTLLPKLLSGQLRIPEAEQLVAEVL
ncbi:restriction endonuclease subunit S [Simiduia sp. 21SJ11W-1]|uniref:restriction endonuclease subunit S n=1 Tax=Simiduia sp. 21SJ11W-1 TaxID=2909669 RepID=UPI0020A23112|nr:restriction endonuclease subunit S [Simiduia sp. 21SJ11W-1]UTA47457.1 restriction endonuclease subunit S [Simiduia sp. 21SJ11W-1]